MEIREKVEKVARETIAGAGESLLFLCKSLDTTPEEVIKAWIVWDTNINEYDNSIYASNAMRIAMHLHNEVRGNWHDERQTNVVNLIRQMKPLNIVEIGFGTPQRYVTEYVFKNKTNLTLLDSDDEGLSFAKAFLNTQSNDWNKQITLRKFNMNSREPVGKFDLYILQDSIEHADRPTEYLKELVAGAKFGSHFILCIPIEVDKAVPEHHIFWKNVAEALTWVTQCGLVVEKYSEITMNPELDLFAKFLHPDFRELLVLGRKV